jgi:4-coumarate--CoA ligase
LYHCPVTHREYTYASLRQAAEIFGTSLCSAETWHKGDVVALFTQNSIDTPVVTWGTHWAGGVVSPANPAYTVRELAHHLKDSGAKLVFTQKALLGVAVKAAAEAGLDRGRIQLLGEEREKEYGHLQDVLKRMKGKPVGQRKSVRKEDLAYLVYSSGTVGTSEVVELLFMLMN